jgi:hypothetical protein
MPHRPGFVEKSRRKRNKKRGERFYWEKSEPQIEIEQEDIVTRPVAPSDAGASFRGTPLER